MASVHVRVPDKVKKALESFANETNMSVSELVRIAIIDMLTRYGWLAEDE